MGSSCRGGLQLDDGALKKHYSRAGALLPAQDACCLDVRTLAHSNIHTPHTEDCWSARWWAPEHVTKLGDPQGRPGLQREGEGGAGQVWAVLQAGHPPQLGLLLLLLFLPFLFLQLLLHGVSRASGLQALALEQLP